MREYVIRWWKNRLVNQLIAHLLFIYLFYLFITHFYIFTSIIKEIESK